MEIPKTCSCSLAQTRCSANVKYFHELVGVVKIVCIRCTLHYIPLWGRYEDTVAKVNFDHITRGGMPGFELLDMPQLLFNFNLFTSKIYSKCMTDCEEFT